MTLQHDPLCPAKRAELLEAEHCWRCDLIRKVRQDERSQKPQNGTPLLVWQCGDCGNTYDTGVRYCPNARLDQHAVTTAKEAK